MTIPEAAQEFQAAMAKIRPHHRRPVPQVTLSELLISFAKALISCTSIPPINYPKPRPYGEYP